MAPPYDHEAIHPHEYVEAFEKYIEGGYQRGALGRDQIVERLIEIALEELDSMGHYAVEIDLLTLLDFNQRLGEDSKPQTPNPDPSTSTLNPKH